MELYNLFSIMNVFLIISADKTVERQNIVLIIADDLGWNDVSFHGSDQIATPNIDLLAYSGISFERYYSHAICTPSRSALLTGKFAHRVGMQGYPLTLSEDRGLPVKEKLLPQYLKELGYATHLIGKWHIGDCRTEYLPTSRGFDSFFGHKGGYIDYYEYTYQETWATGKVSGMCLHRNTTPAWDVEGYITDVYTEEAKSIIRAHDKSKPLFLTLAHNAPHSGNEGALLQAPPEYVRAMRHVESPQRRMYAAMVKKLDESVGDIIETLLEKNILHETVIVFISDNGGMTSGQAMNYASNWPLRGIKMSPFEGGVRVVGLLWTSTLPNHSWKGYIHAVDWFPTLLRVAGANPPSDIDGIDLWNQITSNNNTLRNEMFEIDDYSGYASVTLGDYKLVTGSVNANYSDHQGRDLRGVIGTISYEDTIKNSKMYSILDSIGKPFNLDDITTHRQLEINCNIESNLDDNDSICLPEKDKSCLFNIKDDPCERKDLSELQPDLLKNMLDRLQIELNRKIPRTVPLYRDPRSAPKYFNYTWSTFADNI